MKIHHFNGIYQERWGFSWAMLVSGRVTVWLNLAELDSNSWTSRHSKLHWLKVDTITLPENCINPWKWMVGRWLSFGENPNFQVRAVSFREGKSKNGSFTKRRHVHVVFFVSININDKWNLFYLEKLGEDFSGFEEHHFFKWVVRLGWPPSQTEMLKWFSICRYIIGFSNGKTSGKPSGRRSFFVRIFK